MYRKTQARIDARNARGSPPLPVVHLPKDHIEVDAEHVPRRKESGPSNAKAMGQYVGKHLDCGVGVTPDERRGLLALAKAVGPDVSVPVPAPWLMEILDCSSADPAPPTPGLPEVLTQREASPGVRRLSPRLGLPEVSAPGQWAAPQAARPLPPHRRARMESEPTACA